MKKFIKIFLLLTMVFSCFTLSSCEGFFDDTTDPVVKPEPDPNPNPNPDPDPIDKTALLQNAINKLTNFSFDVYDNTTSTVLNSYDFDGITLFKKSNPAEYLTTENNETFYYFYLNSTWYKTNSEDEYFEDYLTSFELAPSAIKAGDFVSTDSSSTTKYEYVIEQTKLQSVGNALFGDFTSESATNTYKSITLVVENENVVSLTYTSEYATSSVINYDIEYQFTNIQKVNKIDLPNAKQTTTDKTGIITIYDQLDESTVEVAGYICGIVGNNIYVCDETAGIYIYYGKNSMYVADYALGKYIVLSGTKTTYNGLVEITNITDTIIDDKVEELTPTMLKQLDGETLKNSLSMLVSFENATITSLPATMSSKSDISVKISDGTNETTLFISKYLDSSVVDNFISVLENSEGKLTITNAVVGYYKNCQIALMEDSIISSNSTPIVVEPIDSFYPSNMKTVKDVAKSFDLTTGMPCVGNPKILVLPVAFTDAPAPANMIERLNLAFFGTSAQTGYESLASYYTKSSYGKLNITGTILPVFQTGKSSSYYGNKYLNDENADYEIIKEAAEYYDNTIDFSEYDSDSDGYVDALYIVYTADIDYESEESMWWAYTYEYFTEDYEYYDNVEFDYYTFFGFDFLDEAFEAYDNPSDDVYVENNALTIIHESGHLLGLDDYYDYEDSIGPVGGIGGGDMMDYNVGDHNAYSKTLLGWTTPYVVCGKDTTVTLESFEKSGDCVIIAKNWNGSYYSEYLIIDYYTPTGVNEDLADYNGLFGKSGIRIYHIDATLATDTTKIEDLWTLTKFNNTDTNHKLIKLIEADGRYDIESTDLYESGGYSEDSDLFQLNSTYTHRWYDGTSGNFTIKVTSLSTDSATITIDYK